VLKAGLTGTSLVVFFPELQVLLPAAYRPAQHSTSPAEPPVSNIRNSELSADMHAGFNVTRPASWVLWIKCTVRKLLSRRRLRVPSWIAYHLFVSAHVVANARAVAI
jgi:hypothetical protein